MSFARFYKLLIESENPDPKKVKAVLDRLLKTFSKKLKKN